MYIKCISWIITYIPTISNQEYDMGQSKRGVLYTLKWGFQLFGFRDKPVPDISNLGKI